MSRKTDEMRDRAIIRCFHEGLTGPQTAAKIGCTIGVVNGVRTRYDLRLKQKQGGEAVVAETAPKRVELPPSPAMIRLAEFDPVVKRALNERLGLDFDTPIGFGQTSNLLHQKRRGDY